MKWHNLTHFTNSIHVNTSTPVSKCPLPSLPPQSVYNETDAAYLPIHFTTTIPYTSTAIFSPNFNFVPSPSWVNFCLLNCKDTVTLWFVKKLQSPELQYSTFLPLHAMNAYRGNRGILDCCGCSALQHQTITSGHISSWVSISSTVLLNNSTAKKEGGAWGFRGVPSSTNTCTLLKFISKFRTWSKVRLMWKCHIICTSYMRSNKEWQILYEPIIWVPIMLLII
jgi:hypothetical protein